MQDEALTSEQRKLYIGKATKVSRAESEVLQKKTIKFQKVGVLEGKSLIAKPLLYNCTVGKQGAKKMKFSLKEKTARFSTKEKMLLGEICSHLGTQVRTQPKI